MTLFAVLALIQKRAHTQMNHGLVTHMRVIYWLEDYHPSNLHYYETQLTLETFQHYVSRHSSRTVPPCYNHFLPKLGKIPQKIQNRDNTPNLPSVPLDPRPTLPGGVSRKLPCRSPGRVFTRISRTLPTIAVCEARPRPFAQTSPHIPA